MFQLDGLTVFDTIYPNVDGTASGFVTLLGAAHALSLKKETLKDPKHRPIMFSFFQGVSILKSGLFNEHLEFAQCDVLAQCDNSW